MHKIEAAGHQDNLFTEGNPGSGQQATVLAAVWLNAVQQELINVIEGAGLTPKTAATETQVQLLAAINALISNGAAGDASTTVKGLIELADATEAQGLADAVRGLTPSTLNAALQGANQSFAANGYQKLPGGLIIQWGSIISAATTTVVTFPIAFPSAVRTIVLGDEAETTAGHATTAGAYNRDRSVTGFTLSSQTATETLWLAIGN